ncbi:MAG: DinB family protein [Longimicrobiales bacterium]
MNRIALVLLGLAAASPAAAQDHMDHAAQGSPMVASARSVYETVRGYITRAADQMPAGEYAFKPTPDVRSFGQLIAHIASGNYSYCSIGAGVENPNSANIEETITDKAGLVKALGESFAHCDTAYQVDEMKAHEMTRIQGAERPRFFALVFNAAHDFEHYGNIVTYMRMKGLVPPSSQR